MILRQEIAGVILCGGEGRRIGSPDKPLIPLGGRPMVTLVREALEPQVGQVLISANEPMDRYSDLGSVVIPDEQPGLGPLGGLASALAHVETPYLFCCPGDAPFLHPTLVAQLSETMVQSGVDIVIPHDGERQQHLFMLLRTSVLPSLQYFIQGGGRSVHEWIEGQSCAVLATTGGAAPFLNVNTPADLRAASEWLEYSEGPK